MKKNQYVKALGEGDKVDDLFLVKSANVGQTKNNKPYLILTVMDKTGEISGPVWDGVEQVRKICEAGSFIHLMGSVQSYRDKLQLRINQVRPVGKESVDASDFQVSCEGDLDQMGREIQSIIQSVENNFLRKLLHSMFQEKEWWTLFQESPAAKTMHHAYLGGLLEHSLSMAQLADLVASHYGDVDRSLLIAGALLHDVGKMHELAMDMGLVNYTDVGRLKGHLVMGSELVASVAAGIDDFPPELLLQIQHIILSHHGHLEFGSPTLPMTVEALLLSQIDDMDAKKNMLDQLRRKMKGPGYQWSEYQRSLERYLYLRPIEEDDEKRDFAGSEGDSLTRQKPLF